MSPTSKSKSKLKDKSSPKVAKEQQKAFTKPSGSTNIGSGSPANAYNLISGTFHSLETTRYRTIDDTDGLSGSSQGTATEYDSISYNDSCSSESEDLKEKITLRQETIPGADNDKREKIRKKNEKKHQREKRAQELHERCCGYLMSRKLEVLSQQLVVMGFSSERATLALILNEGKVEESISWLFDGGEEEAQNRDNTNLESGSNLKIDISEELTRIAAMEISYKCSKQEVERAVVASERGLEKVEEILKAPKEENPFTLPKLEEVDDTKNLARSQEKPTASAIMQQRRNENDFKYTKPSATMESINRTPLVMKINHQKPLVEKRSWPATRSNPSISYSLPSPIQQVAPPPANMETRHIVMGHDGRIIQQVREPVIMMQCPHSLNIKHDSISGISASPPQQMAAGWYPNNDNLGFELMRSNGNLLHNHRTGGLGVENLRSQSQRFFHQSDYYKHHRSTVSSVDLQAPRVAGSWSANALGTSVSSLTVPSSLGLFSGWGSPGSLSSSSSHLDWNIGSTGGSMPQCDYTSIDWSLGTTRLSSKSSGMWRGLSSLLQNNQGMSLNSTNGVRISGSQDGGVAVPEASTTSSAGSREWTSHFAGKDMFSTPRQFVTSPSPQNKHWLVWC